MNFKNTQIIYFIIVALSLISCTSKNNDSHGQVTLGKSNSEFSVPNAIRFAQLPPEGTLTSRIYMDEKTTPEGEQTIDVSATQVSFTLTVLVGSHTFRIEFEYSDPVFGNFILATATSDVINVAAGSTQSVDFLENDYQPLPDQDDDNNSNVLELTHRTDPADNRSRPLLGSANSRINTVVTSASHSSPQISFNDTGDGIAVWEVNTGTGRKLLYSIYTNLDQQWSEEALLAAQPGSTSSLAPQIVNNGEAFAVTWKRFSSDGTILSLNARVYADSMWRNTNTLISVEGGSIATPQISSNGTGFAIAWRQQDTTFNKYRLYAKIYPSTAEDNWGGSFILDDPDIPGDVSYDSYQIASNNTGYAVIWAQTNVDNSLDAFANIYDGTTWLANAVLLNDTVSGGVNSSNTPTLASNGSGYQFAWWQYDSVADVQSIFTKGFHSNNWSSTVSVKSSVDSPYFKPKIASNGTNYAITWTQQTTGIFANIGIDDTWSGDVRLDAAGLSNAWQPSVVSNSAGYAVIWSQNAVGGERNVYAAVYQAGTGTWSSAQELDSETGTAGTPQIVTNNTGYAAVWTQQDTSGTFSNIWASIYDTSWQTAVNIEQSIGSASTPNIAATGDNYAFSWEQDTADLSSQVAMRFYSNQYDPIQNLLALEHNGSVRNTKMIANGTGKTLATWQQYHNGNWRLYANIYENQAWGTPVRFADNVFTDQHIASDDSGFLVAWHEITSNQSRLVRARLYVNNDWEVTKDLGSLSEFWDMRAASNGSGYGVVWIDGFVFYASLFNGALWTASPENLGGSSTGPFYMASNGSGYAFTWGQQEVLSSIYTDVWNTEIPVQGSAPPLGLAPKIASNNSQYAIIYQQEDTGTTNLYASLYTGSVWGASVNLDLAALTSTPELYKIASDQSGYAVVWRQADASESNVYANVFDGTVWQTNAINIDNLPGATGEPDIASNDDSYLAVWRQQDGGSDTPYSAYANLYAGSNWQAEPISLENSSETVTSELTGVSNGTSYAIAWLQKSGEINNVTIARYEDGLWIYPVSADDTDGEVFNPLLIKDAASYSLSWLQINPNNDPVAVELWSKMNF